MVSLHKLQPYCASGRNMIGGVSALFPRVIAQLSGLQKKFGKSPGSPRKVSCFSDANAAMRSYTNTQVCTFARPRAHTYTYMIYSYINMHIQIGSHPMTSATLMSRFFENFGPRDATIPWILVIFVHIEAVFSSLAVLLIKSAKTKNGNTVVLAISPCSISLMCHSLCFMQTFEFSRV